MTTDEAVAAYSALPADRQIAALARYAFEMTIVARETYVPGTEDIADPQRLRLLNERQHRVMGHICHLLDGDPKRYDDDSIVRIVVAIDDVALLNAFETAIKRLKRRLIDPAAALSEAPGRHAARQIAARVSRAASDDT